MNARGKRGRAALTVRHHSAGPYPAAARRDPPHVVGNRRPYDYHYGYAAETSLDARADAYRLNDGNFHSFKASDTNVNSAQLLKEMAENKTFSTVIHDSVLTQCQVCVLHQGCGSFRCMDDGVILEGDASIASVTGNRHCVQTIKGQPVVHVHVLTERFKAAEFRALGGESRRYMNNRFGSRFSSKYPMRGYGDEDSEDPRYPFPSNFSPLTPPYCYDDDDDDDDERRISERMYDYDELRMEARCSKERLRELLMARSKQDELRASGSLERFAERAATPPLEYQPPPDLPNTLTTRSASEPLGRGRRRRIATVKKDDYLDMQL